MKKTILTLGLCLAFFATNAQEISKNALGIRLGDNKGFGSEINYQRGLGNNNRLEFGLGWRSGNRSDTFKIGADFDLSISELRAFTIVLKRS